MLPADLRITEPGDNELQEYRRCLEGVTVQSFVASTQTVSPSNPTSRLTWSIRRPDRCNSIQLTLNNFPIAPNGALTVQPICPTTYTLRAKTPAVAGRRFERTLGSLTVALQHLPVPVTLSVTGIQSFSQEDSNALGPFDTEDDEPYVLCFTMNVPLVRVSLDPIQLIANLPRPRVVKVGPWEDADDSEVIYPAPPNLIWDADSGSLTTPNDILLIAALVEADNSDPETVRSVVETLMFKDLSLLHVSSIGNRNDFARRMVASMSGNVGIATTMIGSGGVIDPDDRIGEARELRLTQCALERAFVGGESHLSLSFRGDEADYRVYFALRRA